GRQKWGVAMIRSVPHVQTICAIARAVSMPSAPSSTPGRIWQSISVVPIPPYSAFGCRYVCFGVEAPYKFALYHNLPFPAKRRTAYSAAIRHYYNCIFPVLSMENCTKTEVFGIFYIVRVIFQFYLDFFADL